MSQVQTAVLVRQEQGGRGLEVDRSEQVASGSATRGLGGELVQLPTSRVGKMRSGFDFPTSHSQSTGLGFRPPSSSLSILSPPPPLPSSPAYPRVPGFL